MANLTEVLAIVNDKGGVGKSTTAHNLACAILRERPKFRVLIIDLDAQEANVSRLCGWNPSEHPSDPTINEAMINKTSLPVYIASDPVGKYSHRLYICPSSSKLLYIAPFLQAELSPRHVLNRCLGQTLTIPLPDGTTQQASIQDAFDYIIIDCPPAMGRSHTEGTQPESRDTRHTEDDGRSPQQSQPELLRLHRRAFPWSCVPYRDTSPCAHRGGASSPARHIQLRPLQLRSLSLHSPCQGDPINSRGLSQA